MSEEDLLEEVEQPEDLPQPAAPSQREAVLVSDADSPMGEQIILQLILARCGPPLLEHRADCLQAFSHITSLLIR